MTRATVFAPGSIGNVVNVLDMKAEILVGPERRRRLQAPRSVPSRGSVAI